MNTSPTPYWKKLQDPRWQKKRLFILQRDNWTCRDCGETTRTLHVHHCFYEKGEPWETGNILLLTLCDYCHETRQGLQDRTRLAMGLLMAEIEVQHHVTFLESLCTVLEVPKDYRNPIVVDSFNADSRWYLHACYHPEFRPAYEAVTGKTPEWHDVPEPLTTPPATVGDIPGVDF